MKNRIIDIVLCAVILFIIPAYAHSGMTDANGGNYERGEYHCHNGYPAHQHVNGKCPYDFDYRKGETKISNGDIANQTAASANVYGMNKKEAFAYAALGISISAAALVHRIFKR